VAPLVVPQLATLVDAGELEAAEQQLAAAGASDTQAAPCQDASSSGRKQQWRFAPAAADQLVREVDQGRALAELLKQQVAAAAAELDQGVKDTTAAAAGAAAGGRGGKAGGCEVLGMTST
jgi:hypothetical protein